jgi:hypothetical protein
MRRSDFLVVVLWTMTVGTAALAEPIAVRHIQRPMHRFMVARSEDGKTIASGEFSQVVQGDEITMRMTYRFVDGSIDDETTTYRQQGTFRLVSNHHIERGPFFAKPIDFTVEAATGIRRRAFGSAPDLTGGRTDGSLGRTNPQGRSVSHPS